MLYTYEMVEYFTQAIVLDKEDFNETDSVVYFYTEELGRVTAKAKGLKKPLSKLNAHLETLNFAEVRFVSGKNGNFQLVDALSFDYDLRKKIKKSPAETVKFLKMARFVKEMTFDLQKDLHLWHALRKVTGADVEEKIIYRLLLKILGFDPKAAVCSLCHNPNPAVFYMKDHVFLCEKCSLKVAQNEVVLI